MSYRQIGRNQVAFLYNPIVTFCRYKNFTKKEKKNIANLSDDLHIYCKNFIFVNTLELFGGFGEYLR